MGSLGYRPALNGVRGLAIFAVLALHFFHMRGGGYGVDLFFVLSGFLISTLLLEERDRTGAISLRSFYVRRARRLLPALYVLIAVALVLGTTRYPASRLLEIGAASVFYVVNIVRTLPSDPHVFGGTALDHLWSLSEEEQFYVLWPTVLIFALRRVSERALLGMLLSLFIVVGFGRAVWSAHGGAYITLYFAPPTHADGLVIGCAAAIARRQGIRIGGKTAWTATVFLLLEMWTGVNHFSLVNLAAAAIILNCAGEGSLTQAFSWRPLVYLGAISYSVYLWHQLARSELHEVHPYWSIALTVPLALGSYYFIERPFRTPRESKGSVKPMPALADAS